METNKKGEYKFEFRKLDKNEWTNLLSQFRDASLYQTWSYAAVLYGSDNIDHLIVKRGEEIVSIAQICIKKYLLSFTGTANIHWGPVWRKKDSAEDTEAFKKAVIAIKNEYGIKQGLLVRIRFNEADADSNQIKYFLRTNNFICNSTHSPYRTIILNINLPLEEIRKNFEQKWRNQLNRAEKKNLTVSNSTSDKYFEIFMELQKEMRERKGFTPGVNYRQYQYIQNDLPDSHKMMIFLCKDKDKPIAVSICSGIGEKGIYLLGATATEGLKFNGSNLLQWEMIKWLRQQGCIQYDLGGIDPALNPGVYHYKRGIGGKSGQDISLIGEYVYFKNWVANLLYNFMKISKHIQKIIH